MKLVKQSYEILEQEIPVIKMDDYSRTHFNDMYIANMLKHIEKCGRTCYKSLDKITEDSAVRFVTSLCKSHHLSVLEHGTVYLMTDDPKLFHRYNNNPYSRANFCKDGYAITTTYRVIIENDWTDDLKYICIPTEKHAKRHTVLLHTCIHVYKDLTRHRKMSFSIESTRYCNYSKGKFGGELKFIEPCWEWKLSDEERNTIPEASFNDFLIDAENTYLALINKGWQPQQAAEVLPQCTAADVVMSGYEDDWEFVMELRVLDKTGKAHPLVHDVLDNLYDDMCNRGWIFANTGEND